MFDRTLVEHWHQILVTRLEQMGDRQPKFERTVLSTLISSLLQTALDKNELSESNALAIQNELLNRILGLGPLETFFQDPEISEIMVNGTHSLFIERLGKLERCDIAWINEQEILHIINRIVGAVGRRIDESSPLVDARLNDGSRVHAVIAPLSRIGPVLTIRRFPKKFFTLQTLESAHSLSSGMANFLRAAIRAKQNIVLSGATGSGKTSTLNALGAAIASHERLITIEDTAEIRLNHPHLVSLEARPPNIEGSGEITIRTLLKNALRMRPDRIIVGEIRGGEALDMLQAMNTGHPGSLTSIHANSPEEALLRLETMALMTDIALPLSSIREQIRSAVHFVIQQERLSNGERKIIAISELQSTPERSGYSLRRLFYFDKLRHRFTSEGILPERLPEFEAAGIELKPEWFDTSV